MTDIPKPSTSPAVLAHPILEALRGTYEALRREIVARPLDVAARIALTHVAAAIEVLDLDPTPPHPPLVEAPAKKPST